MSSNDYYPMGTWGGDPRAPWNQPDPEDVEQYGESWDDSDYEGFEISKRISRLLREKPVILKKR